MSLSRSVTDNPGLGGLEIALDVVTFWLSSRRLSKLELCNSTILVDCVSSAPAGRQPFSKSVSSSGSGPIRCSTSAR